MMLTSNFVTDLYFFNVYKINMASGFWPALAHITAGMFIFLVGVSLALSHSRTKIEKTGDTFTKYLKRGASIFSLGALITLVTWLFIGKGFVVFGILHFIGLSVVLAYPFLKKRSLALLAGTLCLLAGLGLNKQTFDFPWLVWLGFRPAGFYTVDYFPLLPWFGIILFGLFFGNLLYRNNKRTFGLPDYIRYPVVDIICFIGRNSLLIYMAHQPVIVAALHAFGLAH